MNSSVPRKPRPIAEVPFTDGAVRAVYEEADGRQYVMDGRERVYGVWLVPDEPAVADSAEQDATT